MHTKQITFRKAIVILYAVTAAVSAQTSPDKKDCKGENYQKCEEIVQSFLKVQERKLLNGETEEQLNKWCGKTENALQCVNDFVHCKPVWGATNITEVINNTRDYSEYLCKGSLRTEYLKHAPCLKNASETNQCFASLAKYLPADAAAAAAAQKNKTNVESCCLAHKLSGCTYEKAKEKCSEEASKFASKLEQLKISTAFEEECGSDPCGTGDARRQNEFTISATFIALFVLFSLSRL